MTDLTDQQILINKARQLIDVHRYFRVNNARGDLHKKQRLCFLEVQFGCNVE